MNLKCLNVRDDIINQILYDYEAKIVEIDKLEDKSYYEYRKKIVYINSTKQCIIPGYILNYYCHIDYNSWKQYVCTPSENTDKIVDDSIDGQTAWVKVLKILRIHYTDKEIKAILKAYGDTKGSYEAQFHYVLPKVSQNVIKLPLCVKYDINGAHADAIASIFPKAIKDLVALYNKSKKYINYFVGMLQNKGYHGAYWYIVDRTTQILKNAMNKAGGRLIYANTDGFCVQYPDNELPTSHVLGEFKEEYKGTVYFYSNNRQSPYYLYQFGKDFKGSCITAVRQDIDLSKGQVVYYNRVKYGKSYLPKNIVKEQIQING